MIKNPGAYRQRQKHRASMSFVTAEILQLQRQAEEARAEQARLKRPKRKKQPRHVRIEQPMMPLNPHKR